MIGRDLKLERKSLTEIYLEKYSYNVVNASKEFMFSNQDGVPIDWQEYIGCDKGEPFHSYISFYDKIFEPYRDTATHVCEIGVWKGWSIRLWNEYFTKARITGVDYNISAETSDFIRLQVLENAKPSTNLIIGDAIETETFDKVNDFDIIIDDGSHRIGHQIETFHIAFPKLKPGGLYIIEDIMFPDRDECLYRCLHHSMDLIKFDSTKFADNLVVYRK